MGEGSVDSRPTDSCRLDWLSLSYYAATEELQEQQLAYWMSVLRAVVDEPVLKDGAGRRFFEHSVFHDAGLQCQWSPPDGAKNPGLLSVHLKGEIFKLLSPAQRAAIYLDAADLEGFKHATRLDAQRTILDPIADAEQVHRMVVNREAWVPRYSSYTQLGPTDSKGDAVKGASLVWGGRDSSARGMTYNKALEDKWEGVRAVRHEVMLRRQPARDSFATLVELLRQEEGAGGQHLAEVTFAQSVLAKQMTYLDTTRLAQIEDKRHWPENWARDSEPASFWQEVITGVPVELKTVWRAEKSLEDTMRAMNTQYGRKGALWALWRIYAHNQSREDVMEEVFAAWMSRVRVEDLEDVVALIPEERRVDLYEAFEEWQQAAAHNVEGFASKDPVGGKTDPAL